MGVDIKVLCSSTPMEGVFVLFIPLGQALVAAGHDVVVATGADLEPRATPGVCRRGGRTHCNGGCHDSHGACVGGERCRR